MTYKALLSRSCVYLKLLERTHHVDHIVRFYVHLADLEWEQPVRDLYRGDSRFTDHQVNH